MEKIIYVLSRAADEEVETFATRLRSSLAPKLIEAGAGRLTIAVSDQAVASAAPLRISNRDVAVDAVIGAWFDSANSHASIEALLRDYGRNVAGYLVTESEPLPGDPGKADGGRTDGMMQIAMLCVPPGMDKDKWYSIWRDDHTGVAIETQSTFVYRQNLVVRALTADAPDCAAIVEEAFPEAAMTSQHAFYDAIDDDDRFEANRGRLWASSKRFVDLPSIEVIPTSEYVWP